jgi:hypothetical protein
MIGLLSQVDIRTMPEGYGGVEFKDVTNIHPLAIIAVLVLGICMLVLPRRWAVVPMLIIACFIPSVQKIVIFGLDFNLLRIMVLFGVARLLITQESRGFSWKRLDTAAVLWTVSSIVIFTIREGSFSALVNRLGFAFDALGMYFLFRCLIRDWTDIDKIVLSCILISIPVAFCFIIENRTGRNLFSIFGGVPEITVIREGRLRCQGAFSHPIIAGCFWAALMPLFAARWWRSPVDKLWSITGLATSSIIVLCCASSTPVCGVISGIIGGIAYYSRRHMKRLCWSAVGVLVLLQIVMKAPVWFIIARISAVGGSTSYYRAKLIDGAIEHLNEWVLIGTNSTGQWFWGAQDIANQYILEGVRGGGLTLVLFIYVIVIAFGITGKLWRQNRDPYRIALSWALGVSLFVHCMNFIGVSYFGQIYIVWYLLLAMIGSMDSRIASAVKVSSPQRVGVLYRSAVIK